MQILDIEQRV